MNGAMPNRRWSPSNEGNCVTWIDALRWSSLYTTDTLVSPVRATASGDPIGRAVDQLGARDFSVSTATNRPTLGPTTINGLPGIVCDGVDDFLGTPNISITAGTIFCIWKPISIVSFSGPCSLKPTNNSIAAGGLVAYYNVVSGAHVLFPSNGTGWTSSFSGGSNTLNGTACLWTWSWGSTFSSLLFQKNRASMTPTNTGTYTTTSGSMPLFLGCGYSSTKGSLAIGEIICFGEQLSTAKIDKINKYLSTKWGTP